MAMVIPGCLSFPASSGSCLPSSPASPSVSFSRPAARLSTTPLSVPRLSSSNVRPNIAFAVSKKTYIEEDYLVKKMSAKEVEEIVKGDRSIPVIVDFYATWCGPCILMAQELEMLAVEYEQNALFIKVDTDDEYELAQDMQIRGLPTLYFISPDPNKNAIRVEGLVPREMIKNIIDNEM
ncbi:hypothetical protein KSP39_PZI019103 [Platanthera zijinensis]|uniref:Thioredoxin-like protein CITRX, chloroplastic n=1 Tax=Platanthera zijinensis TaxID=2320716 RepID=A0AAP0B1D7_9ASPA